MSCTNTNYNITFTSRSSSSIAATHASKHLQTRHCRIQALARPSGVLTLEADATAPTVLRTLDRRLSRGPGFAPGVAERGTRSTRSRKAQNGMTPATRRRWLDLYN